MVVEKTEDTKLYVIYDTEDFRVRVFDSELSRWASRLNVGKTSVNVVKAMLQKKLRKVGKNLVDGAAYDRALDDIYQRFCEDYNVGGESVPSPSPEPAEEVEEDQESPIESEEPVSIPAAEDSVENL